jgi:Tfp pilus assembly protein PilN
MLRFMTHLKAQPLLSHAQLSLHQISPTDRNKPYRFEFSADWHSEADRP